PMSLASVWALVSLSLSLSPSTPLILANESGISVGLGLPLSLSPSLSPSTPLLSANESGISVGLGLPDLRDRKWHLQQTCALTRYGLDEGLGWMAGAVAERD
ncbi:hypothetical protein KIPB_004769, partial [Kipferlia bialata]